VLADDASLHHDPQVARLTYASVAGSLVMSAALMAVHVVFQSQLALAQAADSFSDMLAGVALIWAVRQASRPPDEDHPLGHGRAEPLAALIVAVLAGVLAVEVLRNALMALLGDEEPSLEWPVAAVFTAKVLFKGTIVVLARRALARHGNPALAALQVDARNDVLVGAVALGGVALARVGAPAVDSILAIGVSIYVGYAGIRLARENVGLLLGAAVSSERRDALARAAREVRGVRGVDRLVATWAGASVHVYAEVAVDRELSLRDAHAIGHAVESRLAGEEDVSHVIVHVGPHGES
jgi:ferrous-iron efflux pump FieF